MLVFLCWHCESCNYRRHGDRPGRGAELLLREVPRGQPGVRFHHVEVDPDARVRPHVLLAGLPRPPRAPRGVPHGLHLHDPASHGQGREKVSSCCCVCHCLLVRSEKHVRHQVPACCCRWSFTHSGERIKKQEFSDSLPRASIQDLGVILMGAGYEVTPPELDLLQFPFRFSLLGICIRCV
jgi:hypothetical protein